MKNTLPPGLRFAIIHRAFKYKLNEHAKKMGLTSVQLRILSEISFLESSGKLEVNQKDLKLAEQVTHPTITETIKRLEKKGFVTCSPSSIDRRYKKISCTEKSANIHKKIEKEEEQILQKICQGLTPEEINTLLCITDQLLSNISKFDKQ